jgi:glycopeptide antibiotics resistance protein
MSDLQLENQKKRILFETIRNFALLFIFTTLLPHIKPASHNGDVTVSVTFSVFSLRLMLVGWNGKKNEKSFL